MEPWQQNVITLNRSELIKMTDCHVYFISMLTSAGVLSEADKQELSRPSLTPLEKSDKLYDILFTRTKSFAILKNALQATQQTGALQLLSNCDNRYKFYGSICVDPGNVLGKGCYNTKVCKGSFGGREVAVKIINCSDLDPEIAMKEIEHLKVLDHHENIVRYFTAEQTKDFIYIALELCCTTVQEWVVGTKLVIMEEVNLLKHATCGLQHLHGYKIIHGDLKPANILLNGYSQVKIADFGLSRQITDGASSISLHSGGVGTEDWAPPEAISKRVNTNSYRLTTAADIFSLGCIYYFVLSKGEHLFGEKFRRPGNILDNKPIFAVKLSQNFLIEKMISHDPTQRPSVSTVLQNIENPGAATTEQSDELVKHNKGAGIESTSRSFIQIQKDDIVKEEDFKAQHNSARSLPLVEICDQNSSNNTAAIAVPLEISCPGKACNSSHKLQWKCKECLNQVEYEFDGYVYCSCGKPAITNLLFRCVSKNHGIEYGTHQVGTLQRICPKSKPPSEINILLLGETGVGKSTFINGFRNFLEYTNLEEAEHGELFTLIPSRFTVYDENFQGKMVTTWSDHNDSESVGESATQSTKVYQFRDGNTTIRIIDTPGIGNSRGIEQDKKNFKNILGTLSFFKKIHGICILLKPNNPRLHVMFRFCIKELLTYLHKDASRNIVFCFTNSRSTSFRPGDTMPALQKLLSEIEGVNIPLNKETVYCFDNEAYRYLAAIKNTPPVKYSEQDRKNYKECWDRSLQVQDRMLKYIETLIPHEIESTVNLNRTREIVIQLSRPLAEIRQVIHYNVEIVEKEKLEISTMRESKKELLKRKVVKRVIPIAVELDHPRTVCAHPDCVEIHRSSSCGPPTTIYKTICHDRCGCGDKGNLADTLGNFSLMKCRAFKQTPTCKGANCKHDVLQHLRIYYTSVLEEKETEDPKIVKALEENWSEEKLKQSLIDSRNKEIREYEEELNYIEEACAYFAYFLKHNAITPYNDAQEQYLELLINEEMNKVTRGSPSTTLRKLESDLASYLVKRDILEKNMNSSEYKASALRSNSIEIRRMIYKLKTLKHSGKELVKALECVEHAKEAQFKEIVVQKTTSRFPKPGKKMRKINTL